MNADIAHAVWERPKRRRRSSSSAPRGIGKTLARAASALVALLCLGLALWLAAMHPLGALPAVVAVLGVALLARYFWAVWPGWLLALVPLIGLAPWTGWLWVEEWDLLLLASAAGGYAAIAGPHLHRPPQPQPVWRRELRWRAFTLTLLVLWATSVLLAVVRGVVDSGGLDWQLFQGYQESGQALRAAKPVLALALMAPLWLRSAKRAPQALMHSFSAGMLGVVAVVAIGALVERLAFAGFTNFGSEYRTTSLFWEMHVGGGALDGALALGLPFALLALLRAQTRWANAVAVALALLGAYALLTTFSRGLYLGAGLGLGLTLALWARQGRRPPGATPARPGADDPGTRMAWAALPALLLLLALGALVAWQMFPSSNHRGLIGVCGALVALLAQPPGNAAPGGSQRLISSAFGALLAVPVAALGALGAGLVDKAAYAFHAMAWVSSLVLARWAWQGRAPWRSPLGDALRAGAWLSVVGLTAVVAWSWGGDAAAQGAAAPLAVLALAWPLSQGGSVGTSLATLGWRPRLWAIGAVVGLGGLVAAMATADTITERATESVQDLAPRLSHWQRVPAMVALARGELLGAGSGRFLPLFALNAPVDERIGDYRWLKVPEPHLALAAGRHPLGPNQLLRLTQQLDEAPPGLVLRLNVRNARPVRLLTEVCERHLLYVAACLTQRTAIPASHEAREVRIDLGGNGELGERGWPRKGLVFALALESPGLKADITRASLRGSNGAELLRNGSFAKGTAHWFFTSDRNHLPWHAKNLALHWYFEQGWVGLVLGVALGVLALIRVSVGSAAAHPLAPALAGALLGFFVVGVFDSLVDAARIAFLYGTLLLLSLGLRATPPTEPKPTATPARPS